MNLYQFGKNMFSTFFKSFYRLEVIGLEHFPKQEGVLLCTNHISNYDPPLVGVTCPRPIHFMAKAELFNAPLLKNVLPAINAFPVKRGMSDKQALRKGMSIVKENGVLGLFPEGTRSKTGEVGKGLAGAGFFALKTNAKVVPCAIIGPYRKFKKLKVVYGQPIDFEPLRANKVSAQEASDVIMSNIQQLIEKHRDNN